MAFLFKSKKSNKIDHNFLTNKEPSEWSAKEVGEWLSTIGLPAYTSMFIERDVQGSDLVDISESDLDSLKIVKFSDRKKILNSIRSLTNKETRPFDTYSRSSRATTATSNSETGSVTSETFTEEWEAPLAVKCYHKDDIRTFDIETSSFDLLRKKIEEEYGQSFLIKYRDEEDELVSLNSNSGLKAAVRSAGSILKLYLTTANVLSDTEINMLEPMVDGVVVIDTKGTILYVNAAIEKTFGYTKKQLALKNVKMLMNKKDAKKHNSYLEAYLESGCPHIIGKGRIVTCKHSNETNFKARLSVTETKTDSKHYFMGTLQVVESSAEESPLAILDSFVDPAVVITDQGTIVFFNKSAEKLFGYLKTETIGRNVKMLMPEPFKSEHDSYLGNYKNSGISKIMGTGRDVPVQKKDGSVTMMNLKLNKQEISGKMHYTGMFTKPEEKEELSILDKERAVLKDLPIPAIIIDIKGTMQFTNPSACEILGYTVAEMIGKNVNMLMNGEHKEMHDSYISKYVDTGNASIIGSGRNVQVVKKDGSVFQCKLFVTKKTAGNSMFFTGILQLE